MKPSWSVALAFLVITNNVQSRIQFIDREETDLRNVEIKADVPIQVEASHEKLTLFDCNGTIGVKTFSQMPQIIDLALVLSSFSSVENGALCTPDNLQKVVLINMKSFPVLTQSLLTNCEKLKSFTTGAAQIEPNALKNLVNLEYVGIWGQNVSRFTTDYLQPLINLEEVSFGGCTIGRIEPASICLSPKLKAIEFDNNIIASPLAKGMFENCNTVEELNFYFNEPDNQIEDGAFIGLTNLKIATFNYLNIRNLTKGFLLGLSNVEELVIYRSRIEKVAADAFDGFDNLKKLNLTGIRLEVIESGAFSKLPNLGILNISENKLTTIENIHNSHIKNLDAHENYISNITSEVLKRNFPSLKSLTIHSNPFVNNTNNVNILKKELTGIEVHV